MNAPETRTDMEARSSGNFGGEQLQSFLFHHVESYEELELVVFLRRQRERDWTTECIASELGLPRGACLSALDRLTQRGLVEAGSLAGTFRCAPSSLEVAARLAQLDELYRSQRLTLVMLMSVNAIERLRVATMHHFVDTLRLRDHKR